MGQWQLEAVWYTRMTDKVDTVILSLPTPSPGLDVARSTQANSSLVVAGSAQVCSPHSSLGVARGTQAGAVWALLEARRLEQFGRRKRHANCGPLDLGVARGTQASSHYLGVVTNPPSHFPRLMQHIKNIPAFRQLTRAKTASVLAPFSLCCFQHDQRTQKDWEFPRKEPLRRPHA